MPITLDIGSAPDPILPDGNYLLRVVDATIKPTKDKPENLNLNIKFTVLQPTDFIDRIVWDNFSLLKQSLWNLKRFLQALTKEAWDEDNVVLDENDLIGKFVQATIYTTEYNGKKQSKVREYFPDPD